MNIGNRRVFMYMPHQGKERAYVNALRNAGYKPQTIEHVFSQFVLFDLDNGPRQEILERMHTRGIPVFIYPHAARPMVHWDGIHPVWPHTKCTFVIAPGHAKVMQRFEYSIPMEVTGWTYCEIKPFEPVEEVQKILFGPIHPADHGWMAEVDRDLNQRTFKKLLDYCRECEIGLTVRYIDSLQKSGLEPVEEVNYVQGHRDLGIREIDEADVVVGHQTFAYLALARGKPVLMMGEDIPPHTGLHGEIMYARSWEKYANLLIYPLDILAGDTDELIKKACRRNGNVTTWRKDFIGDPFDPGIFVQRLESYL